MISLSDTVIICYKNDDFVKEFNRLNNSSLKEKKNSFYKLIDEATGKEKAEMLKFIKFVEEFVYMPLCAELVKNWIKKEK